MAALWAAVGGALCGRARRPGRLCSASRRRRLVRFLAEKPVKRVPRWVLALLAASLVAQTAWHARPAADKSAQTLPLAPRAEVLRLAAFGENPAAARLLTLYLQGFDVRDVDYRRLTGWLGAALALDPRSAYPLFL